MRTTKNKHIRRRLGFLGAEKFSADFWEITKEEYNKIQVKIKKSLGMVSIRLIISRQNKHFIDKESLKYTALLSFMQPYKVAFTICNP